MTDAPQGYRLGPITMRPRGGVWHCGWTLDGLRTRRTTGVPIGERGRAENQALEAYSVARMRALGNAADPTLGEAFAFWERASILRKSPSHVRSVAALGRLLLGALRDVPLRDLTTAAVEDELNRFLALHAPSYANIWLKYVHLVTAWAARRGMARAVLFDVPLVRVRQRPKALIPTQKAKEWLEEVEFLTSGADAVAMVLRLQIGLGLRGSEARMARWEWLDFERATYTPGETKGGKAWPRPVPSWLLDRLRPHAKAVGWIAAGPRGGLPTAARVKKIFDRACKAAGLPKLVPHRLRATYATWLSEEGVPIQDIQAALEHKDIRTTALYLGIDLGRIAAAQDRIARKTGLAR